MNLNVHHFNSSLPKDSDTKLTSLEEKICFLYTTDDQCKGNKRLSVIQSGYSPLLNEGTGSAIMDKAIHEIFTNKYVKRRIDGIIKDRDGSFVFDRVDVLQNYKKLFSMCMEDPRTAEQKANGHQWSPDIKTAKSVNDSMAKVLGMYDEIKKPDVGADPAKIAKAAYGKGREQRAKLKPMEIIKMRQGNGTNG